MLIINLNLKIRLNLFKIIWKQNSEFKPKTNFDSVEHEKRFCNNYYLVSNV
jgi:hypothetical protein